MAEGREGKKKGLSRRDFIKGTGLAVGGVAISSTVLGVACKPPDTNVVTPTDNTTKPPPAQAGNTTPITPPPPTIVAENTNFIVDGSPVSVKVKDWWTLAHVLRESLGLTGAVKYSCDEGICGMCTVIMDGKAVLSCMVLAVECEGKSITTVEGLRDKKTGKLHAVQQGFINESGFMCGFCTTGTIMAAKALLDKNPNPTKDEVRVGLSNNLCLCGGYELIQKSVLNAATLLKGG